MSRGLFYPALCLAAAGAVATWSLYTFFADDRQERPQRPAAPGPQREDGWHDASQGGYPPGGTLGQPRLPSVPSRGGDDWQTTDSSRVDFPSVKSSAYFGRPRSPSPRIPSRGYDDRETTDSETESIPAESYTSRQSRLLSPSLYTPNQKYDGQQVFDPLAKTYTSPGDHQSLSPHTHPCGRVDRGFIETGHSSVDTHVSLAHPRSPSPHAPSLLHGDRHMIAPFAVESPPVETNYSFLVDGEEDSPSSRPSSPSDGVSCCRFDDWATLPPLGVESLPVKTHTSLSHSQSSSPSVPSQRHPALPSPQREDQPHDASKRCYPLGWTLGQPRLSSVPSRGRDDRRTTDSSRKDFPSLKSSASFCRTRSPSPCIPSRGCDDQETTDSETESIPAETYTSLGDHQSLSSHILPYRSVDWDLKDYSETGHPLADTHVSLPHAHSSSPRIPSPPHGDQHHLANTLNLFLVDDDEDNAQSHPPSPSHDITCCRWDDLPTTDSSEAEYTPMKTTYSFFVDNEEDHCPSPSHDIPSCPWDSPRTTDSSEVEYAPAHSPLSRPQSPSPSILSDDWQTPDFFELEYSPEIYASLRAEAREEAELRSQYQRKCKEANKRGFHALAQAHSNQSKYHACAMENLNAQASAMIFNENNKDNPAGQIDLHGLFVKEAISYTKIALEEARQRGDSKICLIVGRGRHCDGGRPRLKPAIRSAMKKWGVRVSKDAGNPGRLWLEI